MKKFFAAVIFILSLSGVGCAAEEPVNIEPARNFSTSVDEFSWKYFATLDHKENIFYSPYGINAALSILANGATGDTLKEILFALEADNLENLNDGHKNFSAFVAKNYDNFAEVNLLLINKKFIGRGLDKNFKRVVNDVYKSDVREANFSGDVDGEKQKISRWVNEKTKNFIPNYKSIATANTVTDVLNVVYFKGTWAIPFKTRNTAPQNFKNLDSSIKEVDMMSEVFDDKIAYLENEDFKAIKLPYKTNAAMYLIMPREDKVLNVAELWNDYTARADFLNALSKSYAFDGKVIVRLPKFELDIENNLVENFRAMGIKKSFSDAAEFFNIVKDTSLKIGNAQHRAKIKVDEQGTEAAAVTEITMLETTAAPNFEPPRRVYFIADRPFLFLIRDIESDVTLFAGVVNKL